MSGSKEPLLTRDQAAATLTAAGFITSKDTLATKAVRGGGPPFVKFGRKPLYKRGDLMAWAESRLTAPRSNTSAD